jgi:hypothetical protein
MSFTDEQYKQYEKYNFLIANDDIFDSLQAYSDCKKWLDDNNISEDARWAMNERMESECKDGHSSCDLQTLSALEYFSYYVMTGRLSELQVKAYMQEVFKSDTVTLCNGIVIKKETDNYWVDFKTKNGTDFILLKLFLLKHSKRWSSNCYCHK